MTRPLKGAFRPFLMHHDARLIAVAKPHSQAYHGVSVPDPFGWMTEDPRAIAHRDGALATPAGHATRAWWNSERRRAMAALRGRPSWQQYADAIARYAKMPRVSPPLVANGRRFFSERAEGEPVWYWQPSQGGSRQPLLDPATLTGSLSCKRVGITGAWPSPLGNFVAFKANPDYADAATLVVINVATSEVLARLMGADYANVDWLPDETGFLFNWVSPDLRPEQKIAAMELHRYQLEGARAERLFGPTSNPNWWLDAVVTEDGRHVVINIFDGWRATDLFVMPLPPVSGETAPQRLFQGIGPEGTGALHFVTKGPGAQIFVLTNDGAPNWRVLSVDLGTTPETWREMIPEDGHNPIAPPRTGGPPSLSLADGTLLVHYIGGGNSRLRRYGLDGTAQGEIPLPGPYRQIWGLTTDRATGEIFVAIESATMQPQNVLTNVRMSNEIPPAHPTAVKNADPTAGAPSTGPRVDDAPDAPCVTTLHHYKSRDGTTVTMLVTHRQDLDRTRPHPAMLYGYGGFNVPVLPRWRPYVRHWLDRGYIWAEAHLRGGSEYGEAWHRDGQLGRKQLVFDDSIAGAEYLIAQHYTDAPHLAIIGMSNGGLLVGAVMTQRPELFGAAIPMHPLLNMLDYPRWGRATIWASEYGSADDSAEAFHWLHAYSPYHQVRDGTTYPPTLVVVPEHDDRVVPLHGLTFAARLQWAMREQGNVGAHVLVATQPTGHRAAADAQSEIRLGADILSFLEYAGIVPAPGPVPPLAP
ncbi:MAG: S9 family peptidase [Deltaproteobacteria bacterium]|nr:S9 family peptidase [Deltaproteobacteria bacterium]